MEWCPDCNGAQPPAPAAPDEALRTAFREQEICDIWFKNKYPHSTGWEQNYLSTAKEFSHAAWRAAASRRDGLIGRMVERLKLAEASLDNAGYPKLAESLRALIREAEGDEK